MSDVVARDAVIPRPSVDWAGVIAGAVVAAGISFTLVAFGSAIGLSLISTAPTWRDSSGWLWLISGLYLVFVALCSFGLGGYAAGRMRAPLRLPAENESVFRDGMHGLVVWGLATLLSAILALAAAAAVTRAAAPSGGTAGPATSVGGETIIASELDELFRGLRPNEGANIEYDRAQASRILLKTSSHNGISAEDRDYLARLVATRTSISDAEASDRVNRVIDESAAEIHRARVAAVIQAFLVGAALLIGAAVAWFSAAEGGRDRERGVLPVWDWSWRSRRV